MIVVAALGCTQAATVAPPVIGGRPTPEASPASSDKATNGEPIMLDGPFVRAASPVAAGQYLVAVGGCGNCHTAPSSVNPGATWTERELAGNPVGYRGEWGTTYAANLRLAVQRMSEDKWTMFLKTHTGRPPMPWWSTQQMNERDLRAMYRYIRSLGGVGKAAPKFVPSDREPTTPYIDLRPKAPSPR